jgi:hypothetical protein
MCVSTYTHLANVKRTNYPIVKNDTALDNEMINNFNDFSNTFFYRSRKNVYLLKPTRIGVEKCSIYSNICSKSY